MVNRKTQFSLTLLLVGSCFIHLFQLLNQPKTAYVQNAAVFAEFKGKVEIERKLKHEENQQKGILDSLGAGIEVLRTKLSAFGDGKAVQTALQEREAHYEQTAQTFLEEQQAKNYEYTEEIWKQINQYVLEYGKENGYDYIFGASGNGSMMYAGGTNDITEKVIEFINRRYEGI
ncbi:MAG: hypothetical protein GC192_20940 [Bacteroidetes bacterium]|nr:hypothetical protein [Bacteroidota bacterium]